MKISFKTRCLAIVLMAAGYGWAGGHYIPPSANIFAYLFQFVILGVLLLFGLKFFSLAEAPIHKADWSTKGLNIFSVLFFVINVLNVVHGFFNTKIDSFGSHNTFADLVPIVIILIGAGLWIVTILPFKKSVRNS